MLDIGLLCPTSFLKAQLLCHVSCRPLEPGQFSSGRLMHLLLDYFTRKELGDLRATRAPKRATGYETPGALVSHALKVLQNDFSNHNARIMKYLCKLGTYCQLAEDGGGYSALQCLQAQLAGTTGSLVRTARQLGTTSGDFCRLLEAWVRMYRPRRLRDVYVNLQLAERELQHEVAWHQNGGAVPSRMRLIEALLGVHSTRRRVAVGGCAVQVPPWREVGASYPSRLLYLDARAE